MNPMPGNTEKRRLLPSVFSYNFRDAGRGPTVWGFFVLIPFLLILVGWAYIAPINAAAIATGEVVLNQDRKTIQHLEGGILDEILVQEGDLIKGGEPIVSIRDVAQRTRLNTIYDQLGSTRALYYRLIAERDASLLSFSKLSEGLELSDDKLEELKSTQTRLFETRQNSLNTKIELIKARQISAREEISGLSEQLKAIKKQHRLAREEASSISALYDKKLVTTNRIMNMERTAAELEGDIGSIKANLARLEQSILSADIEIIDLKTETRNSILEEIQQTELSLRELSHQLIELTDELERTIIRAPVGGVVMDMQFHTRGAVIRPGERILDLVPNDDRLIIEARVNPNDIDLVKAGTKTKVLLTAYNAKKVPKLDGEVLNVSADILNDQATGERYFLARILVDDEKLEELTADVSLYPGMPAQSFFLAGERTVIDYLFSPFKDAAYRAFREE